MKMMTFENTEDMFDMLSKMREQAAEAAKDCVSLDYGQKVLMKGSEIDVIGEITNPLDYYDNEDMTDPETKMEYESEKAHHEQSKTDGYYFGKWWSDWCTMGELGSNHVINMELITDEEFEQRFVDGGYTR